MKNTRTKLLKSALALLLAVAMLVGSTFAWFTDSVTSKGNVIQSGSLDIEMYWTDNLSSGNWYNVEDAAYNTIFTYDNWEPGYTDVKYIKLVNNGDLAMNYKLSLTAQGSVGKLAEVINVYFADSAVAMQSQDDLSQLNAIGLLNNVMNGGSSVSGTLLAADQQSPLHPSGEVIMTVAMHMITTAGNEYQGETSGEFTVTALATQAAFEKDAFGSAYDTDAEYPEILVKGDATAAVTPVDGKVPAGGVTLQGSTVSAFVPEGVVLEDGTKELTLTVTPLQNTTSDITVVNNEILIPVDVHIAGVAASNTVPIVVNLGEVLPKYLNMGNYRLFHVENGVNSVMTLVDSAAALTAHNRFTYDPMTGAISVAMANFSEVAMVANTDNAWQGNIAESFGGGSGTEENPYLIGTADQLAYLGDRISNDNENYGAKHYKLLADIDLGGETQLFYPIGYTEVGGQLENGDDWYTYGGAFKGVFDGNGHTISNIYQNTWSMKGDYDGHYWDAAMGLFGYVYGGTVKNLTVNKFESDGEFTPTGVIAAYAAEATFENIAITNCNPRVYNTGNGGIVGVGGNTADTAEEKMTFTNITVDNSNKISALWGSWDVACGGLMGMFRGYSEVTFTNCHVAAQIDVFNDVCGNYQYYWYRYAGMIIGSLRGRNTTDGNGYTVPDMTGIFAKDCTVHFGDWNDYYYCELVSNSLASYTHDHQFSRLDQIQSVSEIQNEDGSWKKTGNFILMNGKNPTNTCYHIRKNADGTFYEHTHDSEGTEVVGGVTVLKENNQRIYLPFNQLFQGDGWGVKHIPLTNYPEDQIKILDRKEANSAVKFEKVSGANKEYSTEETVKIGDLFKAAVLEDNKLQIKGDKVQVTVSPIGADSTVTGTYVANPIDWTQGTLTFHGLGAAIITITDYYFCTPTTLSVGVATANKFQTKFDGNFLYRVGNAANSPVALGTMFKEQDNVSVVDSEVALEIETIAGGATGTYVADSTDWTQGKVQFTGTGIVKLTLGGSLANPVDLVLEVIDAVNATTATNATSNNVVLLNDIGSGFTVSGDYTVYGNGFTLNYTGNGEYLNNGLRQGLVKISENGTLDNLRIKASIYPSAYMYYGTTTLGEYVQGGPSSVEGDKTRYHYQLSGVAASGSATIQNCYIYGGRTNIFVDTGDVTIKDTVVENGTLANIQIQSTNEYVVTLENVTTIQQRVNATIGNTNAVMLGAGVIVGPDTTSNPTIVLNGSFKQYNWVNADDKDVVTNETAQMIIGGALDTTAFNHTVNGKTASNLGIIYVNQKEIIVDNNTGLPYAEAGVSLTYKGATANGTAYSLQNASAEQIYSDIEAADRTTVNGDYLPTFKIDLGNQELSYDGSEDTRYMYGDEKGITALYQDGDEPLTLDLTKIAAIYKYAGLDYAYTAVCKNASGNALAATNGVVTLDAQGTYTLEFTVKDNIFYDKTGAKVEKSVPRTFTVPVSLTVKEAAVKNAEINITKTALDGVYNTVNLTDYELQIKFLDCISVTDYDNKGTGTAVNLSSNIASATLTPASVNVFASAFTATITYNDGRVLTVNFSQISGSSPGTKTGKVNTSGSVYFTTNGALNNKPTEASSQNKCTITSVSYKGNSGSTVTNDTDVTVTWALGSSGGSNPCVTPDTLVTLADGTQKRIDQVTYEDQLLVWNFYEGKYDVAPIAIIFDHGADNNTVIELNFSDGTTVKAVNMHQFFDANLNELVTINKDTVKDYVGHKFAKHSGNTTEFVELVSYSVSDEYVEAWGIMTAEHYNIITEGMLSADFDLKDVQLFNYFEIGDDMKFDETKMQADIEKYGLYTYNDFADYLTPEQFVAFNVQYFKIPVEKGLYTYEGILDLIEQYLK